MSEKAVLHAVDHGVMTITLNRPEVLNSLNMTLLGDLRDALAAVRNALGVAG